MYGEASSIRVRYPSVSNTVEVSCVGVYIWRGVQLRGMIYFGLVCICQHPSMLEEHELLLAVA